MTIRSKFAGRCATCGRPIAVGAEIEWSRGAGSRHAACVTASPPAAPVAPATPPPAARECLVERHGSAWTFRGPIETKDVPKAAGWRWHPADCSGGRYACTACPQGVPKKAWWTDSAEKLGDLVRHYEAASGDKPSLRFCDAETEALARSGAAATTEALAASRATDADIEIPVPAGLAYLGYQRAGIAFATGRPSTLIADEMGLGKTIQAIGVINADPIIKRVLVLCPASLRVNWRNEMRKWLTRPMTIELPKNGDLPSEAAEIAVVNYDKLVGKSGRAMLDALMGRGFDLLVADEAHFLKNPKAQRTIAVLGKAARKDAPATPGLASRARRAVFLTGTPILNKPIEAHPLLAALSPAEFGDFFKFGKRYCNAHKEFLPNGKEVWNFNGSSHLDELQERLRKTVMVRRLKADVLKDLPAKRRQIVTLALDDDSTVRRLVEREWAEQEGEDAEIERAIDGEDAYRTRVADLWASQRERDFGDDYGSPRRSRGSKEKAGVDFTGVSTTRHQLALAKVPAALEYLDGMLEEGITKVVVFAHHLDVIAQIVEHFGDSAVSITGQTPMDARQAIVDRFQTDSSAKVFVGNLRAAGVGLTLTAASDVVFVELDWTPANVSQAEDRCHRIGQRRSVHVRHLVIDESLEVQMAKVIVEKQDVADAALDDPRAALEITRPVALPPRRTPEGVTVGAGGERTYPVATDEQRRLAHLAVRTIAGVCDGAQQKDDMGFSGADTSFGHRLAECETLTDGQVWAATRLARKYRRQLDAGLVEALGVGVKPEKKRDRLQKHIA